MPVDPDVEDRFQKFIAEAPGSRRQPKTAEEREALAKLQAQQARQYNLPKKVE